MKEATGELNITVITIIAISAVAALFYAFIWPMIKNNINRNTYCSSGFNCKGTGNARTCDVYDKDNKLISNYSCPERADTSTTSGNAGGTSSDD